MLEHRLVGIVEVADDPVETDTGEPVLALELLAGLGEQHDIGVSAEHRTGELGVAAVEPDVDGVAQMALGEVLRSAAVDQHGAAVDRLEHLLVGHRA